MELLRNLQTTHYISLMIDGATDSGVLENEINSSLKRGEWCSPSLASRMSSMHMQLVCFLLCIQVSQ